MPRHHESGMPVSDPSPCHEQDCEFYMATILSDVEECSEPSSPDLSVCSSYEGRRREATKELQVLIRQITMQETDIAQVAEEVIQFSERKKTSLIISGEEELFAKFGVAPPCFAHEITKLMVKIKGLGKILALRAHESHIKIVSHMLERARFDLKNLKVETFFGTDSSPGMAEATILGEKAFQELEESLFERFPMAKKCFDTIKPRDSQVLECLCWQCIIHHIDVHIR